MSELMAKLLKRQKQRCNHCELLLMRRELLEIDHIIPVSKGGRYSFQEFTNSPQTLPRH